METLEKKKLPLLPPSVQLPLQFPLRLLLSLPLPRPSKVPRALAWASPESKDRTVMAPFAARLGATNAVAAIALGPGVPQVSQGGNAVSMGC
ncbi:unnamed protein product [Pylaiella littoralis]